MRVDTLQRSTSDPAFSRTVGRRFDNNQTKLLHSRLRGWHDASCPSSSQNLVLLDLLGFSDQQLVQVLVEANHLVSLQDFSTSRPCSDTISICCHHAMLCRSTRNSPTNVQRHLSALVSQMLWLVVFRSMVPLSGTPTYCVSIICDISFQVL